MPQSKICKIRHSRKVDRGREIDYVVINATPETYAILDSYLRLPILNIMGDLLFEVEYPQKTSTFADIEPVFCGMTFLVNERAKAVIGDELRKSGELINVIVKGSPFKYFLFNPLKFEDALNHERSKWKVSRYSKQLLTPVFIDEKLIGDWSIFCLREDVELYTVRRESGGIIDMCARNALSGVDFIDIE